jgi:hypothetical protein
VRGYTNDFYSGTDLTSLFMEIDHGVFTFEDQDLNTQKALDLIHLLDFFNAVGHNWKRGIVSLDDIVPTTIGYAAVRAWNDPVVQSYLDRVHQWDLDRYQPGTGFRYFTELGRTLDQRRTRPLRRTLGLARVRTKGADHPVPGATAIGG